MKVAIIFSSIFALASADFTINTFLTAVNASTTQTITWSYDGQPPMNTIQIDLVYGSSAVLPVQCNVLEGGNPNALQYNWTIPADTPSANDYALKVTGSNQAVYYSGRFTINGVSGSSNSVTGQSVSSGAHRISAGFGVFAILSALLLQ